MMSDLQPRPEPVTLLNAARCQFVGAVIRFGFLWKNDEIL